MKNASSDAPNGPERTASRCLIMTFGAKGVGDHLTASPVVRNLAQNHPSWEIELGIFSPLGGELFKYNPYISAIHLLDMDYVKAGGTYSLREKIRKLSAFRRRDFDRVYVLGSKFRHALFAFLTGAPVRVGFDNSHRKCLLTRTGKEPLEKNVVERFLDVLRMDGVTVSDPQLELFLSEREDAAARECLLQQGIGMSDPVLALAPFAADMRRTWGLDRFWEVARTFADERGYKVIVLGASQDRRLLVDRPIPKSPAITDLIGKLKILETAAVIRRANLFLSNDSGLAHIAGAVGTRSLVLGYFITRSWSPMSSSVRTIIKDNKCTSCKVDECRRYQENGLLECLYAIEVKEVIENLVAMGVAAGKSEG